MAANPNALLLFFHCAYGAIERDRTRRHRRRLKLASSPFSTLCRFAGWLASGWLRRRQKLCLRYALMRCFIAGVWWAANLLPFSRASAVTQPPPAPANRPTLSGRLRFGNARSQNGFAQFGTEANKIGGSCHLMDELAIPHSHAS